MAGCFGNSSYDRWLERQVDAYCYSLEEVEFYCSECGKTFCEPEYNEEQDEHVCPYCGSTNYEKKQDAELDYKPDYDDSPDFPEANRAENSLMSASYSGY